MLSPITTNSWRKNIVADNEAPLYYTPAAIWGFSVFFTVIFGAVLLSSNLTDKKSKWTVIGIGLLYTVLAVAVLNVLPRNTLLTTVVNGCGAFMLTSLYWNKYIGKGTKFRAKPIWKPLIISIAITIPFLFAIIYGF